MIFIPPPPPKKHQRKDTLRRAQQRRKRGIGVRPSLGKQMRNTLSTSQGMSTLKIVLIYSVLGMILSWVLPIILLNMYPEMSDDDAQYFGMLGAIIITFFFLLVSLLKGLIQRSSRSQQQGSKTQPSNTQLFETKNPITGNKDGR